MITHLMALPSPLDDVRLMCGPSMKEHRSRRDYVTHSHALATCIACLRAYCARADIEKAGLLSQLPKPLEAPESKG